MENKFWEELKKANQGNKIALEIIEEAQNNPKKKEIKVYKGS